MDGDIDGHVDTFPQATYCLHVYKRVSLLFSLSGALVFLTEGKFTLRRRTYPPHSRSGLELANIDERLKNGSAPSNET